MVVTYGDLGRGPGSGGVRVSFGLVKEIVVRGPSPERTRLRELVAGRGGAARQRGRRSTGSPTSTGGVRAHRVLGKRVGRHKPAGEGW